MARTEQTTASGYLYDSPGNLTSAPPTGTSYTFDAENRLISTCGQTYLYDGDGKRVEKPSGSPPVPNKLYWYHYLDRKRPRNELRRLSEGR